MQVVNIFSRRQKKLNQDIPDCYQYSYMSDSLRVQLMYVVSDFLGVENVFNCNYIYEYIHNILCREYGVETLFNKSFERNGEYNRSSICHHIKSAPVERCLDVFELLFSNAPKDKNSVLFEDFGATLSYSKAVDVFNYRLKEEGLGYRFENGFIFRVDSEFIHSEVTKPALEIVSRREEYKPALEEFITAHDHYKKNNLSECVVSCGKSLEALLKSFYRLNDWEMGGDSLQKLVAGAFSNNLIPSYLQDQFCELRKIISSGVGNIRNKSGAHGKDVEDKAVPISLVRYLLSLTASNLLFLSECNEEYMSNHC